MTIVTFHECECAQPIIRCDHLGCRCELCGGYEKIPMPEPVVRSASKPVAWRLRIGDSDIWAYTGTESDADFCGRASGLRYEKQPLYAAAPVHASPPEPVALTSDDLDAIMLEAGKRHHAWLHRGGVRGQVVRPEDGFEHWVAVVTHERALAAAPASPSAWRSIEDAPPKDGTWVDLWGVPRNGCQPGRLTNCAWEAGAWRTPSIMSDGTPGVEIDMDVTHWAPLPSPPSDTEQESSGPYTCMRCLAGTWNDNDLCDDCCPSEHKG